MKIMTVWNEGNDQHNVWKKIHDHQVQQPKERPYFYNWSACSGGDAISARESTTSGNMNVSGFHYAHFSTWALSFVFL